MKKLKTCPFCGEEPIMITVGNTSSNYDAGFDFYVKCYFSWNLNQISLY